MHDVRIGTSGWAYKDWNGPFYPEEVKAAGRLEYISRRFRTLEINASFYRMPTDAAVAGWREQTPDDFVFAWKASRFITHNKKLKDPVEPLAYMFERANGLGPKLGPILFQLPPNLHRNDEAALKDWAKAIRQWRKDRDVVVYFDNDIKSAAPRDAEQLIGLLDRSG